MWHAYCRRAIPIAWSSMSYLTCDSRRTVTPRRIDDKLVAAQEARRVLDRMVGYKGSPALWRTVKRDSPLARAERGHGAGLHREREIKEHVPFSRASADAPSVLADVEGHDLTLTIGDQRHGHALHRGQRRVLASPYATARRTLVANHASRTRRASCAATSLSSIRRGCDSASRIAREVILMELQAIGIARLQ